MNTMLSIKKTAVPAVAIVLAATMLLSCSGRRASDMQPSGETVEVVIPTADEATDSAVAAGDTEGYSVTGD